MYTVIALPEFDLVCHRETDADVADSKRTTQVGHDCEGLQSLGREVNHCSLNEHPNMIPSCLGDSYIK